MEKWLQLTSLYHFEEFASVDEWTAIRMSVRYMYIYIYIYV